MNPLLSVDVVAHSSGSAYLSEHSDPCHLPPSPSSSSLGLWTATKLEDCQRPSGVIQPISLLSISLSLLSLFNSTTTSSLLLHMYFQTCWLHACSIYVSELSLVPLFSPIILLSHVYMNKTPYHSPIHL